MFSKPDANADVTGSVARPATRLSADTEVSAADLDYARAAAADALAQGDAANSVPWRNPQTGDPIVITERRVLNFKASQILKHALNPRGFVNGHASEE